MKITKQCKEVVLVSIVAVFFAIAAFCQTASAAKHGSPKPTIVLVHGAFVGSAIWSGARPR